MKGWRLTDVQPDADAEQLVREGLAAGCQLLPDAVRPLSDMFCGCGAPETSWQWVLDYLIACDNQDWRTVDGAEQLAAYVLSHLELTEHGTSVRCSWLTDTGREVLTFLQTHGVDWQDGKWIGSDGVWRALGD